MPSLGAPFEPEAECLALDIARFQRECIPGFARLVAAHGGALRELGDIPAVPVDVFRYGRQFCFDVALADVCFQTSGTTQALTGRHWLRDTRTYQELAVLGAERGLLRSRTNNTAMTVVALMPPFHPARASSLAFMCQLFMREYGAPQAPEHWCLSEAGVDLARFRSVVSCAWQEGRPVLLLTTAFAAVYLLDALAGTTLRLPPGSVVMPTGGYKGRTRELDVEQLRAALRIALGEPEICFEYGMTELSSQLYQLPGDDSDLLYRAPPWLRVVAVDPVSLQPVAPGTPGLASFVDLANVDSAVRVLTQDRIVQTAGGLKLLGRAPSAPLRGCSLSTEALFAAGRA